MRIVLAGRRSKLSRVRNVSRIEASRTERPNHDLETVIAFCPFKAILCGHLVVSCAAATVRPRSQFHGASYRISHQLGTCETGWWRKWRIRAWNFGGESRCQWAFVRVLARLQLRPRIGPHHRCMCWPFCLPGRLPSWCIVPLRPLSVTKSKEVASVSVANGSPFISSDDYRCAPSGHNAIVCHFLFEWFSMKMDPVGIIAVACTATWFEVINGSAAGCDVPWMGL